MKVRKMTLNEAVELRSSMPNVDEIAENPKTHFDLTGIGPAYVDSKKLHKRTEDDMKEKNKETDEFEKEYSDEKSKDRIKTEKLHLSESLFDEDLRFFSNRYREDDPGFDEYDEVEKEVEKTVIYQFPKFTAEDRSIARKDYNLEIVRDTKENTFAKGRKEDIEDFAHEFLGYELNPAYMIEECLNEDTVKTKSGKWVNKGDTGETHGEFKTKKAADEQRKAIFAQGFKTKSEALEQDKQWDLNSEVYNALSNLMFKYELKGIDKSDMDKAIEWFNTHFWDDEWNYNDGERKFKDIEGGLGNIGEIYTESDLKQIYNELHDNDPVVAEYDSYEEWFKDTVDNYMEEVTNESLTEAKRKPGEVDPDYEDYDMFTFIYNLFTRDMSAHQRPLNPLGRSHKHFAYTSQEEDEDDSGFAPIASTEDSIILYSNDKSDFDDVKEICDKYDFTYREGEARKDNPKYKFNIEIDVPVDVDGMPMDIEEYFNSIGMKLEDVMPEWYIKAKEKYGNK